MNIAIPPRALARLKVAYRDYILARDKFNDMANLTAESLHLDVDTPGIRCDLDAGLIIVPMEDDDATT